MIDPDFVEGELAPVRIRTWTCIPGEGEPVRPRLRCVVRVDRDGYSVDGNPMRRPQVLSTCAARGIAIVELAKGADESVWTSLERELVAAGVTVTTSGPRGGPWCNQRNPLATGCNP